MTEKHSYQTLIDSTKKTTLLREVMMLLEWDQEICMPPHSIAGRAKQLELIATLHHEEQTSKEFAKALQSLIDIETGHFLDPSLSWVQKKALSRWRQDYLQTNKLPLAFVEEFTNACTSATHVWKEAKTKSDFALFQPYLEKLVNLCRKKAEYFGYENHPYDALINEFEPFTTTHFLTALFQRLKTPLTTLLQKIQTKPLPSTHLLLAPYPREKQLAFGKKILRNMGFEESFFRLDESAHPMCIPIYAEDIRLTTRVYTEDVLPNILSCLHEGGHGLYHKNLPKHHEGTSLYKEASLGLDESQSRTWETLIGKSLSFWQYYFPLLQKDFPEPFSRVSLEDFYKAIHTVKPTLIRTDSDEVTYNLHIMIRFELEKGLIEGTLSPADLPELWNEKMRAYLGVVPKADAEGCLQDIHWALGAFGYFPTYTLGNLYAAQFFDTFATQHPNWKQQVSNNDFTSLIQWQKEQIHQRGREYLPQELCEKVTGKPLDESFFIRYLENKYTALYHLT